MLKSMTAFGRARAVSPSATKDITAEIKSVNSRFLDCTVRLPRSYSFLEERIKSLLSERGITRGKIEISVNIDILQQDGVCITLDHAMAASYINALRTLQKDFGLTDDISVMTVAANRDLFLIKKADDDMEQDWQELLPVLSTAIDAFLSAREREGSRLETDILSKLEKIRECVTRIQSLSESDITGYRSKLDARIHQLLDDHSMHIDEQRILTEVAIFADRAAIDEEIVRLTSHFKTFHEIISAPEPAGRRLDFLLQEMNRETNTIGSKANNAEIARLVVEIKAELEKIREQIQNIE